MQKILFFLSLFISLSAQSQQITGTVSSADGQPMIFTTVSLINETSRKIIKADLTDSSGNYIFKNLSAGKYSISISATGYREATQTGLSVDSFPDFVRTVNIQLANTAKDLQGVVVTSRKKLIEIKPDMTIMNIENSIVATGNSAFDLLRKAPGVSIDAQENIKSKGQVVRIFIDDKPAYLSGEELRNYLKNLQADEISRIEIISNPGSRYPAEGTGGIINIVLKKNKRYGSNGNVSAGVGYGKYPKLNGSGSINYRNKKVNMFSSVGTGRYESYNRLLLNSDIGSGANKVIQERTNYWHPVTIYSNARFGIDYSVDSKSTLGFLARGTFSNEKAVTDNNSLFSDVQGQPLSQIYSTKKDKGNSSNFVFNLNYKRDIDSVGSSFNIDLDYGYYRNRGNDVNANHFYEKDVMIRPDYTFRSITPIDVNIYSLKADWVKHVDSTFSFETGFKLSLVKNDNELIADSIGANHQWTPDYGRTNHFIYDENIYAAYFTISKQFKKLSIKTGARAEYTRSTGNAITVGRVDERKYFNVFPSTFLNYTLNKNNTLNLSYTYRINRPAYQSLNPFVNFVDPFTYFQGNPFLKPSYAHAIELKHGFRDFLFTSIGYRYADDVSDNVILQNPDTKVSLSRTENVGTSRYWSFDVNAGMPITKWWSTDLSGGMGYGIDRSDYPSFSYLTKAWSAYFSAGNTFTLPKKIKLELQLYANAPTRSGIAKVAGVVNVSGGVQKPVLKEKGSLKLSVANFIGPTRYNALYRSDLLHIKWINEWEGKRVNLSFSYKFGNMNVKNSRQRRTASQEESNRVNL
ncbi:TonB-dependent receptor [Ferruginibacter sp. HRS2-29]|uniref:TonB-dependent receptor domain-containing protein n=1 Tax=Ferruginibacter sp. HRS2-29 TaxID=2487334 RepID=UPI0020CF9782|nr:TonB-dependent receptor [Ferruginibacter sp. HRS2-29]MCP9752168.1 TonB-dependent receptor [Ferruginibacter sp. HRS2-29]